MICKLGYVYNEKPTNLHLKSADADLNGPEISRLGIREHFLGSVKYTYPVTEETVLGLEDKKKYDYQ